MSLSVKQSVTQPKRIIILDGGTGMSLVEMGHSFIDDDPLWSAAVVSTHPQDIIKLHKDFFLAGADIVVAATYQASIEGYRKQFGVSENEAHDLVIKGVELAKTARDEAEMLTGHHGYVAASIGPLGATLCDRSEYHGKYADTMTRQELSSWHLPRLKVLIESNPDLLAIETIPAIKEAEAILESVQNLTETKAWVTFQCKDGTSTAHGEDIKEAVKAVVEYDTVIAVGINCVHPIFVTSLLQNILELQLDIPVIVKPNGGIFAHDGISTTKQNLSSLVLEWINAGASWIGGCCYINPSDIAEIRRTLENTPCITFLQNGEKLI